jgi:hypothetical protein
MEATFIHFAPSMQTALVILPPRYPTSQLQRRTLRGRPGFPIMDVSTLILLTPVAIFVISGIIWYWTNELS